jgi:hypothetical protein
MVPARTVSGVTRSVVIEKSQSGNSRSTPERSSPARSPLVSPWPMTRRTRACEAERPCAAASLNAGLLDHLLREDIHFVGELLGQSLVRQEGASLLERVEQVRKDSKATTTGDTGAGARLAETIADLDLDTGTLPPGSQCPLNTMPSS